jgi:hypothetical protein
LEITKRHFAKDDISQRNKGRVQAMLGSNICQLKLGPDVSELNDSLVATFLEMAHAN